jgi:hypothetical protein
MMNSVEAPTDTPPQADFRPLLAGENGRRLRRLWLRLASFFLPIVFIVAPLVYWVDPYNLFQNQSHIPIELRQRYAAPLNQALWKVFAYSRDPKPNIILGDSQAARFPEDQISLVTGEPFANLGAGGATLRETIDMFWFASRETSLHSVYFGINFMAYNEDPRDRLPQAEAILKTPVLYFLNSDVLEAGTYDIRDAVFHHPTNLGPQASRDAFWQSQLQYLTARYRRDANPGDLRGKLQQVVDYAHQHGIQFAFIIPPQHVDAQRRVRELGVEAQYEHFKHDLAQMAPVYDCDIDSSLTRDRNNFLDPFHLEIPAAKQLVSDLWSGHPTFCHVLGNN